MRSTVVILSLLGLLALLSATLLLRPQQAPLSAPTPWFTPWLGEPDEPGDAGVDGDAEAPANSDPQRLPGLEGDPGVTDEPLSQTLRVHGLGLRAVAPVLVANRGSQPNRDSLFAAQSLSVQVVSAADPTALDRALAWGEANEAGADLLIAPLPALLPGLQRLGALSPCIMYVAGWSRGGEALLAPPESSLAQPPPTGALTLRTEGRSAATLLALLGLRLAGVDPGRVQLLAPSRAEAGAWAAVELAAGSGADLPGSLQLSTAAASRLVPYVIVGPRQLPERHRTALVAWLRVWIEGAAQLTKDPPAAARRVALSQGGPEPLGLLTALSGIELCSLRDNTRLMGLAGRPALTLERLLAESYRALRAARLIADEPPALGLCPDLVAAAAQAGVPLDEPAAPPSTCGAATSPTLLRFRPTGAGPAEQAAELGFVAEVFRRATVVARSGDGGATAEQLRRLAQERYDSPLPCPIAVEALPAPEPPPEPAPAPGEAPPQPTPPEVIIEVRGRP